MDKKEITERTHKEWVWLDVFTLGFLISVSLMIFRLQIIDTMDELLYFKIPLVGVLTS
jgi:hypothetical protein